MRVGVALFMSSRPRSVSLDLLPPNQPGVAERSLDRGAQQAGPCLQCHLSNCNVHLVWRGGSSASSDLLRHLRDSSGGKKNDSAWFIQSAKTVVRSSLGRNAAVIVTFKFCPPMVSMVTVSGSMSNQEWSAHDWSSWQSWQGWQDWGQAQAWERGWQSHLFTLLVLLS